MIKNIKKGGSQSHKLLKFINYIKEHDPELINTYNT